MLQENDCFSQEKQIFSFDALLTQFEILNTINDNRDRYIAKLKNNQANLKEKTIKTIESFTAVTDIVDDADNYFTKHNQYVSRKVEVFQNKGSDQVMYHEQCNNIQSLIKTRKHLQTGAQER